MKTISRARAILYALRPFASLVAACTSLASLAACGGGGATTSTTTGAAGDPGTGGFAGGATVGGDGGTGGAAPGGSGGIAGSGGTGGDGAGYASCLLPSDVCLASGEVCSTFGPTAVCGEQPCEAAEDCPAGPGPATPACFDWGGGSFCGLDCGGGDACPSGMECFLQMWCTYFAEPPGGGTCPDAVLGTTLPVAFDGDTTGLFDDQIALFGEIEAIAADQMLEFTAPATGLYQITADSTAFAPYLFALDGCGGQLRAESNLGATATSASMTLSLEANQTIIIGVEGFGGGVGLFTLGIVDAGPPIGGAECCSPHQGTGCSVQSIEDCVCVDTFCCNTNWDGICAYEAAECGAQCN